MRQTQIHSAFNWCVHLLEKLAPKFGMNYEEINIWIFCIIWPIVTVILVMGIVWAYKRGVRAGMKRAAAPKEDSILTFHDWGWWFVLSIIAFVVLVFFSGFLPIELTENQKGTVNWCWYAWVINIIACLYVGTKPQHDLKDIPL